MTPLARSVFIRVLLAVVFVIGGFIVGQAFVRSLEAEAAAWLLRELGAGDVIVVLTSSIRVIPGDQEAFLAVVTPSCSALASLLAVSALGFVLPRGRPARTAAAVVAALVAVAIGNVLRIAGSVAVGLLAGRASLVLFHDWIGGVFTFAYTLGGYMLLLYLLLPRGDRGGQRAGRVHA